MEYQREFGTRLAGVGVDFDMDTSSKMYRYLPQAQDALADFRRGPPTAYSVAVYSFSRNNHRTVD